MRSKNSGPGGTELEAGLFRDMRTVSGGQWWFQGSLNNYSLWYAEWLCSRVKDPAQEQRHGDE